MIRSILPLLHSFSTLSPTQKIFAQRIDRIVQTIRQQLKPSFLRVRDISMKTIDDDQMIRVEVQSQMFRDIPKVDQHRMVIACLGEDIEEIHAFLIKTRIPLMENIVIIKPEEQILEQMLNQQGTIPLETIREAVHDVKEESQQKIDETIQDRLKSEYEQDIRKKAEEKNNPPK